MTMNQNSGPRQVLDNKDQINHHLLNLANVNLENLAYL